MKKSKETVYWISSDASPEEHQRYNEIQRKEEVAFEHKQLYRRRIKKFWKMLLLMKIFDVMMKMY